MQAHPLAGALQKLRQSSRHAIAQGNSKKLDDFSEYFHVEREIEKQLLERIRFCSKQNGPSLILVCGNVGDGKSHILSYLNKVAADELKKFKIHNDATEAHDPLGNSYDTLNNILENFQDQKIRDANDKIILAINLGTLNNFLEIHGFKYCQLKEYVIKKNILGSDLIIENSLDKKSFFHHVNFTDYNLYSLTADGPTSIIISSLIRKLVANSEENEIYAAYEELIALEWSVDCPIRYNYEFFFHELNQKAIANLIIQTIVKHKQIVSVRSLMNFIFDSIVPIGLNWTDIELYKYQIKNSNVSNYLSTLIPNYIFEHPEISEIFGKLHLLDPCSYRYAELDISIINLINSEKPSKIYYQFISSNFLENIEMKINSETLKKQEVIKLFIRLNFFSNRETVSEKADIHFLNYMNDLHHFNNYNLGAVKKIYNLVQESARKWYGDPKKPKKVVVNLGKKQSRYRVFTEFEAKPDIENLPGEKAEEIQLKFLDEFTLKFKLDNSESSIRIHIDFGLYEILNKINEGYRPNKKDNNNYVSFVNLINKIINQNSNKDFLEIDQINVGRSSDYELSKDPSFGGYKFRALS